MWVMEGTMFVGALQLMTFVAVFSIFLIVVMGPWRLFMWPPCQKDIAASSCLLQLLLMGMINI